MSKKLRSNNVSRRTFLQGTAAATSAAVLPLNTAMAQGPAKYRRLKLSNPEAIPAINSYKKAVRKMLELPPSDPRNWYRIALSHTLDCPHGNWWFLVWHRGYTGWFEKICRELSGDLKFALPYWDWSEHPDPSTPFRPSVPKVMFEDVLTPTHRAYIDTFGRFYAKFRRVVEKASYWKREFDSHGQLVENSQYNQLLNRAIRGPDDLWFDIYKDPRWKFFFDRKHSRGLTKEKPELDKKTTEAVKLETLLACLSPTDFVTFASPKAWSHGGMSGFSPLEWLPHNRIHNNVGGIFDDGTDVGGFMQQNLSPVDPLFFLHHSNIDRLWDVWTRKQQALGYPTLPDRTPPTFPRGASSDYEIWAGEPFLFFVDEKGRPVKSNAKRYAEIGEFNYDYEPGSGEEIVKQITPAPAVVAAKIQRFPAEGSSIGTSTAGVLVKVPPEIFEKAATPDGPKLFAKIWVLLPPHAHAANLNVLVNAPDNATDLDRGSPYFVETLSMFGHHSVHGPVMFIVPLSRTLVTLLARRLIDLNSPLNIRVVSTMAAGRHGMMHGRFEQPEIQFIVVEAH